MFVFILLTAATVIGCQALRAGVADEEKISLWDPRWKKPVTEGGRRYRKVALWWLVVGMMSLIAWGLFGFAQIQRRW